MPSENRYLDPAWWADVPSKLHKTTSHYAKRSLEASRRARWRRNRVVTPAPVFVVGCSRAGTTIVKKTLARSAELTSIPAESFDFWGSVVNPANRGWDSDVATVEDATPAIIDRCREHYYGKLGGGRFLDKTCINGFKVPFLQAIWPDARFVYLRRDGRDNINSLIHGWQRYEQFKLYQLPVKTGLEGIPEGLWCFFLEPGWRDVLGSNLAKVCAHQWVSINQALLDARPQVDPSRWIELRYEDLFHRPEAMFEEAFERLELRYDDDMRAHCRNIADNKVSLAGTAPAPEKWKTQNREAIESILPDIAEMMQKLGYSI